jgi:hypothetical protein
MIMYSQLLLFIFIKLEVGFTIRTFLFINPLIIIKIQNSLQLLTTKLFKSQKLGGGDIVTIKYFELNTNKTMYILLYEHKRILQVSCTLLCKTI